MRLHLQGVHQREIGARLGIKQPSVCNRIAEGTARLRFIAAELPDYIPSEVHTLLLDAGERERVAVPAAVAWRMETWRYTGYPQTQVHNDLYSDGRRVRLGFVRRWLEDSGPVGEVARGLDLLHRRSRTFRKVGS